MPIGTSTGERYEDEYAFTLGQTEEGLPFYQATDKAPISDNTSLTPEDTSLKSGQETEGFTKLGQAMTEGMVPEMATRMASDVVAAGTVFGRVGRGEIDLDTTEGFNEVMNAALTFGTMGLATAFKRPGIGMFGGVGRFGGADRKLAEKMEQAGMPDLQIKQATGLERGADSVWRREFSDVGFKLNKDKIGSSPQVLLDDVIQHEELFKRYPEARDIEIVLEPKLTKPYARFIPLKNRIEINPSYFNDVKKQKDNPLDSVLLHEIQHWVQYKEGFAYSPDLKSVKDVVSQPILDKLLKETNPEIYRKIEQLADSLDFEAAGKLQAEWFDYIKDTTYYSRLAEEVEARNVEHRRKMSPDEIKNLLAKVTESVPRPMQIVGDYRDTRTLQIGTKNPGDTLYGGEGPLRDFTLNEVRVAIAEMDPDNKLALRDAEIRDYILENILGEGKTSKPTRDDFLGFVKGRDNEVSLIKTRIRQIQYDRNLSRKAGVDVDGEDYASVRNNLRKLRERLKELE